MNNAFLLVHITDTNVVLKCMDEQSIEVDLMCIRSIGVLGDEGKLNDFLTEFSHKIQQCGFQISSCFFLMIRNQTIPNPIQFVHFLQRTFRPTNLFDVQKEDINLQKLVLFQIPDDLKESEELWDIRAKLTALGALNVTNSGTEFVGALSLDVQMDLMLTSLNDNRLFNGCRQFSPHDFPNCVPIPNPIRLMVGDIIFQADIYARKILESYRLEVDGDENSANFEEFRVPLFLTGNANIYHVQYVLDSLRNFNSKIRFIGTAPNLMFYGLIYAFQNNMLNRVEPMEPTSFSPPAA